LRRSMAAFLSCPSPASHPPASETQIEYGPFIGSRNLNSEKKLFLAHPSTEAGQTVRLGWWSHTERPEARFWRRRGRKHVEPPEFRVAMPRVGSECQGDLARRNLSWRCDVHDLVDTAACSHRKSRIRPQTYHLCDADGWDEHYYTVGLGIELSCISWFN
jgi:hypothetical protein